MSNASMLSVGSACRRGDVLGEVAAEAELKRLWSRHAQLDALKVSG
jgi:hypothetical protein